MISPPSTWTDAHDLMEGASERGLIRETGLFRNICQRRARAYQEILGTFDPELHEPSVSRDTEARLERSGEVADRKAALVRQLREPYSPVEMLTQQLCRTALLPRPQAADRDRGQCSPACVLLEQMRAEDEVEVVQRQRTKPVPSSDEGKNALRQLGENQVFFLERDSEGVHGSNSEIRRDVVQAPARHMKQHVVERASR